MWLNYQFRAFSFPSVLFSSIVILPITGNKQISCHPYIICGLSCCNITKNVRVFGYISRSLLIVIHGLFIANYKFIIPDEDFVILAVSVVLFLKYP
jgi:hypothetical protein